MVLNTKLFGNELVKRGFQFYSGVPCSFLKDFINYAKNECNYVGATNEGEAIAISSGVALGGKKAVVLMQNSGLTNAASPLLSLNYPFRLPVLGFVSLRGEEGIQDEPQHELMGLITTQLLDLMQIRWEFLSNDLEEAKRQLDRANMHIEDNHSFFFVVKQKTFEKVDLSKQESFLKHNFLKITKNKQDDVPTRYEALSVINALKDSETVQLATTGKTGRELYEIEDANNNLYMVGSMGCVSSFGLGLSLEKRDKEIVVIDGDGSLLMRMGSLATNGYYSSGNMLHILLDNNAHDSTGGQSTVSNSINFVEIAAACGYMKSIYIHSLEELESSIRAWKHTRGLTFLYMRISKGSSEKLGRPKIKPYEVKERLQTFVRNNLSNFTEGEGIMRIVKRNILLNPGPATTTDSVKYAQVVPDICPREAEFGDLMEYVSTELTQLVADTEDYSTVLFGGSGTAAVEAIISSVVGDDVVVIINNGAYGKRMCEIAGAYGLNYLEFNSPPDDGIDLLSLKKLLQNSSSKISHLAVVHHETSTGLLNDIESIGAICREHHIDMVVDAMSSYAAIPIHMDKMNISFMAASSNKNLQGIAGVAFVIANKRKLECMRHKKSRNYYLNLYAQHQFFMESRQMRFTPPVQTLYALKQAIDELKEEQVKGRYERYTKSWETLIKGIARLGLNHIVPEKHHSKIITSIFEPDCNGYDFSDMHDYFHSQGFTIYPGKFAESKTFRIANIGDITYKDIEEFLALLENYLGAIGYPFEKEDAK